MPIVGAGKPTLQTEYLAQLGGTRIGHDGAININGGHHAIAIVPLLYPKSRLFVMVDIDDGEGNIVFGQETLDNIAVASPIGGINRYITHDGFSYMLLNRSVIKYDLSIANFPGNLIQAG